MVEWREREMREKVERRRRGRGRLAWRTKTIRKFFSLLFFTSVDHAHELKQVVRVAVVVVDQQHADWPSPR